MFCMDAASARSEACRDKSKGPRSGDFAGRSPGVQGEAATGLPLCAPCAMKGITQKKYREHNLPGNIIEQTLFPGRNRCTPRTVSTKPQFVRRVRRNRHPAF
ncbi:oxidoreductase [Klebsiella quasipneumoniae]|uniref:Oxidoreductase n=1 Tax=Klebsiella quasipneumoniae TaxID=1463165 RepID=A0A2A5MJ54_9ENTR|nr:oxidoreductase [Klebsiella sp. LY]PCM60951.1 oxidoreductase [Klebsiella quasipneumoniae]PLD67393.1 oxidoreductase [Klebsiella quasipneumoniae]PLF07189.1 oxidoreductase [Klebsiella quasipneumoniae]PUG98909.1 oxidoreductase [Klebsiella quasipneumoniae]